uniref:Uncharacterized protein n=1 Tax=Dunaliella tertiolecta TaxID=3047 RepID=A0A7S3QNG5_DUNTE
MYISIYSVHNELFPFPAAKFFVRIKLRGYKRTTSKLSSSLASSHKGLLLQRCRISRSISTSSRSIDICVPVRICVPVGICVAARICATVHSRVPVHTHLAVHSCVPVCICQLVHIPGPVRICLPVHICLPVPICVPVQPRQHLVQHTLALFPPGQQVRVPI